MDIEQMIRLVNTVSASNLTEFSYEESGMTVRMEKKQGKTVIYQNLQSEGKEMQPIQTVLPQAVSAADLPKEEVKAVSGDKIVTSPLVGVFYAAPAEDAEAFVKVGDTVKKGQVLAIVEAMKLMNEIESEYDGVIEEVLISNEQVVEYGQPLFCIR